MRSFVDCQGSPDQAVKISPSSLKWKKCKNFIRGCKLSQSSKGKTSRFEEFPVRQGVKTTIEVQGLKCKDLVQGPRAKQFTKETVPIAWVQLANSYSGRVAPPGIHKGQITIVYSVVWKIFHFESLKYQDSVKKCKLSLSLVDKSRVILKNFQSVKIK